jgi:hypothetical protein
VKVSWEGDQVRVTWQDQGEPNVIQKYTEAGGVEVGTRSADEPNEVLLSSDFAASQAARIIVNSQGADGRLSAWGQSVKFDTLRPVQPDMRSADMRDDLSVRLWWYQPALVDNTPNDPLDRPEAEWLRATVTGPGAGQKQEYAVPLDPNRPFDVPAPPPLSTITLAAGNEWGTSAGTGPLVRVGITRVETPVLARQVYGRGVMTFTTLRYQCNCVEDKDPSQNTVEVEIQARPNSSAPWTKIGRNAGRVGEPFFTEATAIGSRQYRIFVPPYSNSWYDDIPIVVMRAASTAPKTSLTTANFGKVGIFPASAPVSATVKLIVQLSPQVDMKAALQRWDGKQWRYTREVALTKGHADIAIRAAGRGTTTKYRILTPRVMVKGLPVEASTSSPFTLTVR